ncbi:putative receptor protein kinase ZmPK1 [Phoenix dactylifera]|uniref:Receptor-like serine/threonine-protein kinase n=1 Tax=Phoenix dactylifera TaxID=42345 RepID=A0A8B7BKE4_PHODC|nr:putative receptor protein kinase ZmPK1 [Phoenix dactylifera]
MIKGMYWFVFLLCSSTQFSAMRNPTLSTILTLLFLVFLLLLTFASPSPRSSLTRHSYLSVEDDSDILISPKNSFTCGFHEVGSNAFTFSIWFSNLNSKTIVWTVNRDNPVNGHGSRVTMRKDGNVVLTDYDGTLIWTTSTNSTQAHTQLLDTGNLVVKDPDGTILWQSFDYPTDTLLPNQVFNRNSKLVSAAANGSLSSGPYISYFDSNNVLILMYDTPEFASVYWPDPENKAWENGRATYNGSKYAVLDDMGQFVSSDNWTFKASDLGPGIRRRMTLDYDGNLRLYSLDESTKTWSISWVALSSVCLAHSLCGRNGICVYSPTPQCTCPPGFEVNDPSDWSKGCKRKYNIACHQSHQVQFFALPDTDFWGYDFNYNSSLSFRACRKICKMDCSCEAFGYKKGTGDCFPKIELHNGKSYPGAGNNIFLKIPRSVNASKISPRLQGHDPVCNNPEVSIGKDIRGRSTEKKKWANFYGFISAFFVIEVLFVTFGWLFIFRREKLSAPMEEGYRAMSTQFRRFTYKELKRATRNFKEELGRGGSGAVYKGVLDDERVAAVKKLEDVIQGEEEFHSELSFIGRIYHMNLVRMWGFCSEHSHRLLVSEFVENGSLDKVLFHGDGFLRWSERFKIAVGVAKGLAYLHHECLEWVIHCDVKPENILLGQNFEPKIADFGLAKLLNRGGSGQNLSRIQGTRGYIAPEWASSLPITGKVDVYSYGVVLLELVKGVRVSDWIIGRGEEVEMVLRRSLELLKVNLESGQESWICDFVDSRLDGQFNSKEALMMVEIAVCCLEDERSKRPSMESVVHMLLLSDDELNSHAASFQ